MSKKVVDIHFLASLILVDLPSHFQYSSLPLYRSNAKTNSNPMPSRSHQESNVVKQESVGIHESHLFFIIFVARLLLSFIHPLPLRIYIRCPGHPHPPATPPLPLTHPLSRNNG